MDYPEVGRLANVMHPDSLLVAFQYLPRAPRDAFHAGALDRLRNEAGVTHVTWISPDNLVTYFLIGTSAHRPTGVRLALQRYLQLNEFRVPDD